MIVFEGVPHRRWIRGFGGKYGPRLRETAHYRKLMKHVGKALRAGQPVTMVHRIVGGDGSPGHPKIIGDAYDVLDVTIGD